MPYRGSSAPSEVFSGPPTPILILTSPYHAPLARLWRGPVIYDVTDLLPKYAGFREAQVRRLDEQMCRAVSLVCPNSARIAAYPSDTAKCLPAKIVIVHAKPARVSAQYQ